MAKPKLKMKKICSFVILALVLVSCSEDIKTNDSAVFQGVKDNGLWRGADAKAVVDPIAETITIRAVSLTETMTLTIDIPGTPIDPKNTNTFVTYILGINENNMASYTVSNGNVNEAYETGSLMGDGQVVLSEYDGKVVSGTFRFNAENTNPTTTAAAAVNLQNGVFYKVPIVAAF